jgi:hypothetical protein
MNFFRRTAGYTVMDHTKNAEIVQELHMTPILERIKIYKENYLQHVSRMDPDKITSENSTIPS